MASNTKNDTGIVRIFHEGTAFFVTSVNPYDLMAQRGDEVHLLGEVGNIPENEAELRREVMHSDFRDAEYLNIVFDTPAAPVAWWQAA